MKLLVKIYLPVFLIFLNHTGCKKFVEITPPETQMITESVFNSDETANSAILGLYSDLMDKEQISYRMALLTGLGGDEITNYSGHPVNAQAYTNTLRPQDSGTNNLWDAIYNLIYQANAIIEGCQKSTTISGPVKMQLIAESLFMRAYCYFYLLNLYGDVPLILTTDYRINSTASRTSVSAIYSRIISDLESSKNEINVNYVGSNSQKTSTERIRPNKSAVAALLARVYLFKKDYAMAEQNASFVINNKSNYDTVGLTKVFLKNSMEAIWQIMKPAPANSNTNDGNNFILTAIPSVSAINRSSTISNNLYQSFDNIDKRKTQWIGKFTDVTVSPNVDYYYPFKYKVAVSTDMTEYLMVLRLGEQFLIRAESRANLGNLTGAIDDLDVIKRRAGIPLIKDSNPSIGKENLIEAILKERQLELFTEWGLRWMDLKRSGKIDQIMNVIAPIKGATWNTTKQYWPIPQQSLNADRNLVQNQGYN